MGFIVADGKFKLKVEEYLGIPEKKKFYNEKLFTTVAPKYDFVTRALSFGRDFSWKRKLIDALPSLDAPVCVDIACGTGDLCFLLADKFADGNILGLDLTDSMLRLAEKRCKHENITFVRRDMCDTELPESHADIVTGGYALRNAPDLDRALDECRRILKPGGFAAFLDFSKSPSPTSAALTHRLLKFWGVFWGFALHGNGEVYGYIAESLRVFPDRDELHDRDTLHAGNPARDELHDGFRRHGFTIEKVDRFYGGLLELSLLRKNGGDA